MNQIRRAKPMLGSYVNLILQADCSVDYLLDLSKDVFAAMDRVEKITNFGDPDSELSKINVKAQNGFITISDEMHKVISFGLSFSELSDGLFNFSVTSLTGDDFLLKKKFIKANWKDIILKKKRIKFKKKLLINLDDVAIGFAIDSGIRVLPKNINAVINVGGDIAMTNWKKKKVSIKNPSDRYTTFCQLEMCAPAVSTHENFFLNNESNLENKVSSVKHSLSSISVFARDCMTADSLIKVASTESNYFELLKKFSALAFYIDENGNNYWS